MPGPAPRHAFFMVAREPSQSFMNERKMSDLRKSMAWSLKQLRPFRRNRLHALKHFVGNNYSDSTSDRVPLNMIWLAISIYLRQLVPRMPKTSVYTMFPDLKPAAHEMEIALNHLTKEINYAATLKLVVMEAMLSMGILKVGLEVRETDNDLGVDHDAGQPFADLVTIDNWVHDMTAKDYRRAGYAGDRYSMPYEMAMEVFSGPGREKLQPREKSSFGPGSGTEAGAESLSQGSEVMVDEFGKFVDLWDIWLPREILFMTIEAGGNHGPPLEVREWEGPEGGMYHLLRFQPVPDNIMPIAPVMQWIDLSEGVNSIWRKLVRQSDRQKEFTVVSGPATVDGNTIKNANDGDLVSVNNPQGIQQIRHGGVDQQNLGFSIQAKQMLTYLMGNIDAIGGLSAQTSTVGQDQMLSQGANRLVDDMRQELSFFNAKVFEDLAMYLWEDPYIEIPLVKRSGTLELPFKWTPESREGDFSQYNFDIEPYSQRSMSPEEKLQKINEIMTQIVIPSGMQFDQKKYMKEVAKLLGVKELEDILDSRQEAQPVDPAGRGGSPAQTTRRYERISRAGPSAKPAEEQMLQQSLFANGNKGNEQGGQMQ